MKSELKSEGADLRIQVGMAHYELGQAITALEHAKDELRHARDTVGAVLADEASASGSPMYDTSEVNPHDVIEVLDLSSDGALIFVERTKIALTETRCRLQRVLDLKTEADQ